MAHYLLLAFVGMLLCFVIYTYRASSGNYMFFVFLLAAVQSAAMLTHNSAITLIPATLVILLIDKSKHLRCRVLACAAYAVMSLSPYLVIRVMLHQVNSHSITNARYSLAEYLYQTLSGLGQFFLFASRNVLTYGLNVFLGITIIAVTIFGCLSKENANKKVWLIPVIFASTSYICLLIIFNLTWIAAALSDRFLYYFVLCLIPAIFVYLSKMPFRFYVFPLIFITGFQALRCVRFCYNGILPKEIAMIPSNIHIRDKYYISESILNSKLHSNYFLASPPDYKYMKRWKLSQSISEEGRVKLKAK